MQLENRIHKIKLSKSNPLSDPYDMNSEHTKFKISNFISSNIKELSCFSIIKSNGITTKNHPFNYTDINIEKPIDAYIFEFKLNCEKEISFDFVLIE